MGKKGKVSSSAGIKVLLGPGGEVLSPILSVKEGSSLLPDSFSPISSL